MITYLLSYFFSPAGRFRRTDWHLLNWSFGFITVACTVFFMAWNFKTGAMVFDASFNPVPAEGVQPSRVIGALSVLWFIVNYVVVLMATIKRFQDLGMSGWHCIVFYFPVPIILLGALFLMLSWKIAAIVTLVGWVLVALFYLIKLSFFAGDPIENDYGPVRGDVTPYPSQVLMLLALLFGLVCGSLYYGYSTIVPMVTKQAEAEKAKLVAPLQAARLASELKEKAEADLNARAQGGDAQAQYDLAFAYLSGSSPHGQSYSSAAEWLEKSAAHDYAPAEYNLGLLYFEGKGYAVDHGRAYFWLTRAKLRGHIPPGTTDYAAAAGAQLTPETRADIEQKAAAWKPAVTPVTVAPAPAAQPAPPLPVPVP